MSNRAISTELIELGERIRKRRQEMKFILSPKESFAEKYREVIHENIVINIMQYGS